MLLNPASAVVTALGGSGVPSWALGSDLWRDFTRNGADVTDTHAASINALNAAGTYQSFGANILTRTDLGLQTVPTRTNLCIQSEDFGTSWALRQITVSTNQIAAPDGTTTADLITATATSNVHYTYAPQLTFGSGSAITISVHAKAGTHSFVELGYWGATDEYIAAVFDLSDGTAGETKNGSTSGTVSDSGIDALGDGWYRCWVAGTVPQANGYVEVGLAEAKTGNTWAGDGLTDWNAAGTETLYMWGAQAEAGSFPASYIKTTTTSATVNGNQQTIDLTGQLGTGVAGIIQFDDLHTGDLYYQTPLEFSLDYNNRIALYSDDVDADNWHWFMGDGGVSQADISLGARPGGMTTVAFIATANYVMARIVGQSAPTADTSGAYPASLNTLTFGEKTNLAYNLYCRYKKLALWSGAGHTYDSTFFDEIFAKAQLADAS